FPSAVGAARTVPTGIPEAGPAPVKTSIVMAANVPNTPFMQSPLNQLNQSADQAMSAWPSENRVIQQLPRE
ncbi:MAG: hypothetical protein WBW92_07460, partial [Rhodanobacteraceae bacterium]